MIKILSRWDFFKIKSFPVLQERWAKGSRKKNQIIFLMAVPLRPYTPPPSSLIAVGIFQQIKKRPQKILTVNHFTAIKKITFFAASLRET